MSMMDKLKGMLKGHEKKVSQGVDKAGDFVDQKTKGKYKDHVDKAQGAVKKTLGSEGAPGTEGTTGTRGTDNTTDPGGDPQPR